MAKRIKKWLGRALLGGAVLALAAWLAGEWLLRSWQAKPPPLPADTAITRLQPQAHDGKVWLGPSWFGRREGLPVIYLKGSPFDLGYAKGILLHDQLHTLENEFINMVRGYVPRNWELQTLKNYVIYRNRHLSDYIPLDYRMEILAATIACPDAHPELGPYYNRVLNYHAAHDVSYMMIDNPLISRAGCTGFGAWGNATPDGHLITGRNFDWEAAEVFSRERLVVMCEPDNGIPFISVSWAGMAGVISGMNRAGVSVTVNGAPTSLPKETATPVAIVARDIMQQAHNLAEANQILLNAKVFVSTLWLLGSRADGRFIVVEKTPEAAHVREPEGDWIVCANHFQTAGLKENPRNQSYLAEATSLSREKRMKELIENNYGSITPAQAASILRDRKLPGGIFAGNGHRASLNAFIATHATVMDLTAGILWAASPPNQLGKFVAFDVNDFARELPGQTVPADQTLASGEYQHAREARQCLADGQRALKNQNAQPALNFAQQAETLNPGFYQNATLQGRALLALGRKPEAARAFEKALSEQPAFLNEKQQLEAWLRQARSPN